MHYVIGVINKPLHAVAIFLGLETDVSERVVIPYANSPKLCKDTNCFGIGNKKRQLIAVFLFSLVARPRIVRGTVCLCIPLAELLCPQVKNFVLNKRQPCFALPVLLAYLLRSNKFGLQLGHKKKTAHRCLFFFPCSAAQD